MNNDTLQAFYKQRLTVPGDSGYGRMEMLGRQALRPLSSWGQDGYDLGDWPLVVFYVGGPKISDDLADGPFLMATDVEGDLDLYSFPTAELRREAIDYLFGWYAKQAGQDWWKDEWNPEDPSTIPDEMKGPYRVKP